jgi:hypothetical protein
LASIAVRHQFLIFCSSGVKRSFIGNTNKKALP